MKPLGSACACLLLAALGASPARAQGQSIDALWPNDDHRAWDYALHFEAYDGSGQVVDGQVRLWLDGTTVAAGDVAAQYLRQAWLGGPVPTFAVASSPAVADPLLRNLFVARPDLRAAIQRVAADESACPLFAPNPGYSLLLDGELAYRKTADDVSAWRCDLASTRAWQWLASDLAVGSTFTLQLIPDLASNVLLHGTVGAVEDVTVPAGTFTGCVRVDYVVDYGTSTCVDSDGNVLGTARYETQGWVRYAPGVGPVESREGLVAVEGSGACVGPLGPQTLVTQQLVSSAVPTAPTSWGRLKLTYR